MRNRKESVACVIVTYNPTISEFTLSLKSIVENNVDTIIVDNGSENQKDLELLVKLYKNVKLITLSDNQGIASAQNIGIKKTLEYNIDFVWLSDQDTIYPSDYTDKMFNEINKFSEEDHQTLGAIAPIFFDTTLKDIHPIVKLNSCGSRVMAKKEIEEVLHVIASGMFIPANNFHIVGFKNDKLFIDYVDMEWCWRAIFLHNLKIYISTNVNIIHTLGDSNVNLLGKEISIRTPFRHYFIIRNPISLALYANYLPTCYRIKMFIRAIVLMFIYSIIVPKNRKEHIIATVKGFIHGIQNKLGPKH